MPDLPCGGPVNGAAAISADERACIGVRVAAALASVQAGSGLHEDCPRPCISSKLLCDAESAARIRCVEARVHQPTHPRASTLPGAEMADVLGAARESVISNRTPRRSNHAKRPARTSAVSSNCTGRPVFCWVTIALILISTGNRFEARPLTPRLRPCRTLLSWDHEPFRRIVVALLTAGWIIPFGLSYWLTRQS